MNPIWNTRIIWTPFSTPLSQDWTLGDAAYYALPTLSWQAVLIGDPLYRPFKITPNGKN